MNISEYRVLLTGAAGGIGSATARALGAAGAKLILTDLDEDGLDKLASALRREHIEVETVAANITKSADRDEVVSKAKRAKIDTLINIAGINPFGWLEQQNQDEIELVFRINTVAPILLCQGMLPVLAGNSPARIVNVGSAFGAIGYPGFAAYSASKFAIRGFSEALRRELSDTEIGVHYIAPRATRTKLVTDRVQAMNAELKISMDTPETVAKAITKILTTGQRELALGLPERLFAKLNGLLPGLIDYVLHKQLPTIRRYATPIAIEQPEEQKPLPLNRLLEEKIR
jgi:short-subunit dehydrogenase